MLGLVDGPGLELGVGLVVVGVSVPVPPMLEPLLDAPPEVPGELMLSDVPELPEEPGELMPPDVPEIPEEPGELMLPDVPELPEEPGELMLPDVPELPEVPDDMPDVPPELPPELPLVPEPEPPPVMPAHALNSIAQAIGNIHLFIEHSRKIDQSVRQRVPGEASRC